MLSLYRFFYISLTVVYRTQQSRQRESSFLPINKLTFSYLYHLSLAGSYQLSVRVFPLKCQLFIAFPWTTKLGATTKTLERIFRFYYDVFIIWIIMMPSWRRSLCAVMQIVVCSIPTSMNYIILIILQWNILFINIFISSL